MKFQLLLTSALINFLPNVVVTAGVMGIDFGTDWFKVAVVKHGIPLEVVLNKDSKRKTETIVTFKDGIRYYGLDAASFSTKRPQDSYGRLKNLLGRLYEDKVAVEYRDLHDNTMIKDEERGTCLFKHGDKTVYSVELLVAMQLAHARTQCEKYTGDDIRDAIITVPPYWTQHERQALLDAAEIAGLRVMDLINDETAVAINYAMTREFNETTQYHIFYDIGAGSTVATLIGFKKEAGDNKKPKDAITSIEVKAIGYDRTLGGLEIDVRLQKFLAKRFQESVGNQRKIDVFKNHKAMAKLLKEANRVKHILSANNEVSASVESLIDDLDFKTKVSRSELEGLIGDLLGRLKNPLDSVLKHGNVTLDKVQSFILVGGSVRVPAVLSQLETIVGADKVAKHVNADEAAVLGAALRAAQKNPMFRVKKMKVTDVLPFTVNMEYDDVKTRLFAEYSPVDLKKKVSFKKTTDFPFILAYDSKLIETDRDFGHKDILKVNISGVEDGLKSLGYDKEDPQQEAKVKVLVEMSSLSIAKVHEATLELKMKQDAQSVAGSIADTVRSFFGSGDKKDNAEAVEETAATNSTEKAPESTGNTTESSSKPAEPKVKVETAKLAFTVENLGIKPLDKAGKDKAKLVLDQLDAEDKKRFELEEAQNNLESYIYSSRDFATDDKVAKVSTEQHVLQLKEAVTAAEEWLNDEGWSAKDVELFRSKHKQIMDLRAPIEKRISESKCRDKNILKIRETIESMRKFIFKSYSNVTDADRVYLNEAMEGLIKFVDETEQWLNEKHTEQKALAMHQDPVLLCDQIEGKISDLEREKSLLYYKKRPKPTPTVTTAKETPTLSKEESEEKKSTEKEEKKEEKKNEKVEEKVEEKRDEADL